MIKLYLVGAQYSVGEVNSRIQEWRSKFSQNTVDLEPRLKHINFSKGFCSCADDRLVGFIQGFKKRVLIKSQKHFNDPKKLQNIRNILILIEKIIDLHKNSRCFLTEAKSIFTLVMQLDLILSLNDLELLLFLINHK